MLAGTGSGFCELGKLKKPTENRLKPVFGNFFIYIYFEDYIIELLRNTYISFISMSTLELCSSNAVARLEFQYHVGT